MTTHRVSYFLPILLVAGCTAGTDYVRPPAAVAPVWRAAPAAQPRIVGPWWQAFDDPMLHSLIAEALARNLDIEAALAELDRARAAASAAGAAMLPSGTIDADVDRTRASTEVGLASIADGVPGVEVPRASTAYGTTASASWELDLSGGLRRRTEAARYDYEAALASGAVTRITVVAEVADAYLQLRTLQLRLGIAEDIGSSAARLEALVRQRYEAGESSLRELEQARTSAASVRATIPSLKGQIEGQLNRLALLTGQSPEADRRGLDKPGPVPLAELSDLGTPGDLLRNRPDVVAAERRLAAAHARIGVATAEYYPRISLSALAGFQASSASSLLTGSASVVQGAAGLRWRLFDFGRIRAEIADAKGSERSALAAYQQSVLRAATDVETAAALYTAGRGRMAMHEIECASAAHARELLDQAWKAGQIDLSAVIEGDRRLLQGLDALAVARGETARAIVSVYRAIGA